MSSFINADKIKKVYIGTVEVKKIYLGSVLVWQGLQEFVYSTGTLPTGVASLTCYRDSSQNSSASIGVISNGDPIWEGDTLHFAVTASTGYNASCNYTTTGSYTVTSDVNGVSVSSASASLQSFTITFALGGSNYGSWGSATKTAYYGDTLSISGNTVTCSGTASWTNTFTNGSATGYTYSVSYSSITSPVTETQTITATTSRSPNAYTITFSVAGGLGGSWGSSTKTAYYGDTITRSGNTVTCSGTASWTNTFNMPSAPGYTYSRSYSSISSPVSGAQTITATVSRTVNNYLVSFNNVNGGSWNSTSRISAPYGSTISVSGNTVTVNGSSRTFSVSSTGNTTYYYYYLSSIGVSSGTTVTGDTAITPSVGTANKTYGVTIRYSGYFWNLWGNYRFVCTAQSYDIGGFSRPLYFNVLVNDTNEIQALYDEANNTQINGATTGWGKIRDSYYHVIYTTPTIDNTMGYTAATPYVLEVSFYSNSNRDFR